MTHKMYKGGMEYVPDFKRVEMTRFRAGSHRLKIETGRWSRTPQDQRLCDCELNVVQDEAHVVFFCKHTEELRRRCRICNDRSLDEILANNNNINFIYEIMKMFTLLSPVLGA